MSEAKRFFSAADIRKRYLSGKSVSDIANALSIPENTVHQYIKDIKSDFVDKRVRQTKFTSKTIQTIIDEAKKGTPYVDISKMVGCSKSYVSKVARQNGIHSYEGRRENFSDAVKRDPKIMDKIQDLISEGLCGAEIARRLNVSYKAVLNLFRESRWNGYGNGGVVSKSIYIGEIKEDSMKDIFPEITLDDMKKVEQKGSLLKVKKSTVVLEGSICKFKVDSDENYIELSIPGHENIRFTANEWRVFCAEISELNDRKEDIC